MIIPIVIDEGKEAETLSADLDLKKIQIDKAYDDAVARKDYGKVVALGFVKFHRLPFASIHTTNFVVSRELSLANAVLEGRTL